MITIDSEKCTACGLCVSVCPFTVLEHGADKKPRHTGKPCIACMHCAAVCPNDAVTYNGQSAVSESVQPLAENCATAIEQLIQQRRSYRRFRKKSVPHDFLKHVLQIATLVPSAKNEHPTQWIILENSEKQMQLMSYILNYCNQNQTSPEIPAELARHNNPVIGENAALLIGYCHTDTINPSQDTAIALAAIELLLQAEGIGTCWGGYLTRFLNQIPDCRKLLHLPENCAVYGTLLFGYPDQPPYRYIPRRLDTAEIEWI